MLNYAHHKTIKNRTGRLLLEKDIETYYKKKCKELGWLTEKFSSPMNASIPDQITTIGPDSDFPLGFVFFCELKAPGKTATDKQQSDHKERRRRGCVVIVCDSYEEVDIGIEYIHLCINLYHLPQVMPQCLVL